MRGAARALPADPARAGSGCAIFFVVPMVAMLSLSLQTGNVVDGFSSDLPLAATTPTRIGTYSDQLVRSLLYGLIATVACIVLAYPMAYWIAFRGGARKSTYLFLLLLPFFVSFVLRTISWQFLLADNGILLGPLKDCGPAAAGLPHPGHRRSRWSAGLTYNFLPFMVLPIYVALERIDPRLIEAAHDLYATPARRRSAGWCSRCRCPACSPAC